MCVHLWVGVSECLSFCFLGKYNGPGQRSVQRGVEGVSREFPPLREARSHLYLS